MAPVIPKSWIQCLQVYCRKDNNTKKENCPWQRLDGKLRMAVANSLQRAEGVRGQGHQTQAGQQEPRTQAGHTPSGPLCPPPQCPVGSSNLAQTFLCSVTDTCWWPSTDAPPASILHPAVLWWILSGALDPACCGRTWLLSLVCVCVVTLPLHASRHVWSFSLSFRACSWNCLQSWRNELKESFLEPT